MEALSQVSDREIEYVAVFVRSLRARSVRAPLPTFDPAIYGPLYREADPEERALAERGLAEYSKGLEAEDRA